METKAIESLIERVSYVGDKYDLEHADKAMIELAALRAELDRLAGQLAEAWEALKNCLEFSEGKGFSELADSQERVVIRMTQPAFYAARRILGGS